MLRISIPTGYYQQPEVVQFNRAPRDAVVCQGCRLDMQCSINISRQSSAGEQHVPLPELEWIFNGSKVRTEHWNGTWVKKENGFIYKQGNGGGGGGSGISRRCFWVLKHPPQWPNIVLSSQSLFLCAGWFLVVRCLFHHTHTPVP